MLSKEDNYLIDSFKSTLTNIKFEWRPGQREAVAAAIDSYNKGHDSIIINAPVGSGKSIIALAISYVLRKKDKKGYILASDLGLQEQYEKDLILNDIKYGSIKGIDNYICTENMESSRLGLCRINNKIPAKRYACYKGCPYYSARDKASASQVSLLNYYYYLLQQNYVNKASQNIMFPKRDFTICDEAHKISSIIQSNYSPQINKNTINNISNVTTFIKNIINIDYSKNNKIINKSFKNIVKFSDKKTIFENINIIKDNLYDFYNLREDETYNNYIKSLNNDYTKTIKDGLKNINKIYQLYCKLDDYIDLINDTDINNIIKNMSSEISDPVVTLNSLDESYLVNKYFNEHAGFRVYLSATTGDHISFANELGLQNKPVRSIKLESTFNFSNSPIFFQNTIKLNAKNIIEKFPYIIKQIEFILDNHKNENGIIHTSSYAIAQKIQQDINPEYQNRILLYENAAEKIELIKVLKERKNCVIIGPSLLEGIDLKDDLCRFIIFAKIPFLSLGDKFVKAKMEINPDWYTENAVKSVLQGIGRGHRHENDYCKTYFLDGAIFDLILKKRQSFPKKEFMDRLKEYTIVK